jgi:hypothetical protein
MPFMGAFALVLFLSGLATAHFAAWHKGLAHQNPFHNLIGFLPRDVLLERNDTGI